MVLKALQWTDGFWISYTKMVEILQQKFLVALGSKQGMTLKLVNLKYEDWASIQLLALSILFTCLLVDFLVYFPDMPNYFLMKTNKRKVWKCLKSVKEFSCRFDLAIFLSILGGVLQNLSRLSIFLEMLLGKIHPRKVDKSNRESAGVFFFCFVFFLDTTAKKVSFQKFVVPSFL